jgi:hypothetical protein
MRKITKKDFLKLIYHKVSNIIFRKNFKAMNVKDLDIYSRIKIIFLSKLLNKKIK